MEYKCFQNENRCKKCNSWVISVGYILERGGGYWHRLPRYARNDERVTSDTVSRGGARLLQHFVIRNDGGGSFFLTCSYAFIFWIQPTRSTELGGLAGHFF